MKMGLLFFIKIQHRTRPERTNAHRLFNLSSFMISVTDGHHDSLSVPCSAWISSSSFWISLQASLQKA